MAMGWEVAGKAKKGLKFGIFLKSVTSAAGWCQLSGEHRKKYRFPNGIGLGSIREFRSGSGECDGVRQSRIY